MRPLEASRSFQTLPSPNETGKCSPYILPPATPKDRVEILREAFRKVFKDADFHREYKKLVGDDPTPLTAEGIDKAIRELPRDLSIVELFKQVTGADALSSG